jgi:hypothetical protein
MKNLPAREKLDLAEKVAHYLVLVGSLDKNSAMEDFDLANELSLELAMLLPTTVYRCMVEAATQPNAKVNPASVAIMMRSELIAPDEGALAAEHVALHAPGAPEKTRSRAH